MDQQTFKEDFFLSVGKCFQLESLDVSGCTGVDDNAFVNLMEAKMADEDNKMILPGLKHLRTVKMQMMEVSDFAIVNLCKVAPNIEHLELNRLEELTEYAIQTVFKELPNLKFVDL